jgi:1,4-dihydroxy-2-naphthoate octaprenyltransferase
MRASAARAPWAVRMARPVRKTHATDRFPTQMKNIVKLPVLSLVLMRVRMLSRDRNLCLGLEGRRGC